MSHPPPKQTINPPPAPGATGRAVGLDIHPDTFAATRLRRMMALEIEAAPDFLRLYKLAGLNLVTTYALVAIIGDIARFATSKKLVSYLGLNSSVVESGNSQGGGALHQHGRGSLRALLIQASKRLLTCANPVQKWGLSVALRRGQNKAAVAVARKLTVAVASAHGLELGFYLNGLLTGDALSCRTTQAQRPRSAARHLHGGWQDGVAAE